MMPTVSIVTGYYCTCGPRGFYRIRLAGAALFVHFVEVFLRSDYRVAHHILGLGGLAVGKNLHQGGRIQFSGRLLAGLPAQDASDNAVEALLGVVVGAGLHVVALPAGVAGLLDKPGDGDVHTVDSSAVVDIVLAGAAEDDAVVVA